MVLTQRFILAGILGVLLMALPVAAQESSPPADLRDVVVIGTAPIYKGDSAAAREQAVARGLNAAVERAVSDLLPLESLVGSFQTLNQTVFGSPDEFIQGFKVLAENVADRRYRVIVQAEVSMPRITERLSQAGMAVGTQRLPAVLVAVSERRPEDDLPRTWWVAGLVPESLPFQQGLQEGLAAVGLPVTDPLDRDPGGRVEAFGLPASLQTEDAVKLGGLFQAEVVIAGSADVVPGENTMGEDIRTFRASVQARAVRVDTGEVIAETVQKAVAAHQDPETGEARALADAGIQAGRALARQIAVVWRNQETTTADIEVVVEGTRDLGNLVMFRRSIRNTFGVKEVQTRAMQPDQATMTVTYQGSAKALADLLMLNTFERFHVNIYEVTPDRLGVRLFARDE